MRGPIVLAMDSRLIKEEVLGLWLLPEPYEWLGSKTVPTQFVLPRHNFPKPGSEPIVELKPVDPKIPGVSMAFEVPFLWRRAAFGHNSVKTLVLCDYASAGNEWSTNNFYRVWMPQPMFMGNIFQGDL
jgi:hypothetical protein